MIPELEIQPPSSPTSLLNEPISAGVRWCRDSRTSDPIKLTPQRTKHLKMYAKKLCEDNNVPTGEVMCFIDVGSHRSIEVTVGWPDAVWQHFLYAHRPEGYPHQTLRRKQGQQNARVEGCLGIKGLWGNDKVLCVLYHSILIWTGRMDYSTDCLHACCRRISRHTSLILSLI